MKCETCNNYMTKLDTCKYCHYEEDHTQSSSFDLFKLLDQDGWVHLNLTKYLKTQNIECLWCDVWEDNLAIIVGCTSHTSKVAQVLNISEQCIYSTESGLLILNLVEEKYVRGMLKL